MVLNTFVTLGLTKSLPCQTWQHRQPPVYVNDRNQDSVHKECISVNKHLRTSRNSPPAYNETHSFGLKKGTGFIQGRRSAGQDKKLLSSYPSGRSVGGGDSQIQLAGFSSFIFFLVDVPGLHDEMITIKIMPQKSYNRGQLKSNFP